MDAYWKTSESNKIRVFALCENIKRKACQIGYISWCWDSFVKLIQSVKDGYFMRLLYEYYPNDYPLGGFVIRKRMRLLNDIKKQTIDKEALKRNQFVDLIHKVIHRELRQHVKVNGVEGFSPKKFQEEIGLSLSIRPDIRKVTIKKITKGEHNNIKVSIEVYPVGWEGKSSLSFNFEFAGINEE